MTSINELLFSHISIPQLNNIIISYNSNDGIYTMFICGRLIEFLLVNRKYYEDRKYDKQLFDFELVRLKSMIFFELDKECQALFEKVFEYRKQNNIIIKDNDKSVYYFPERMDKVDYMDLYNIGRYYQHLINSGSNTTKLASFDHIQLKQTSNQSKYKQLKRDMEYYGEFDIFCCGYKVIYNVNDDLRCKYCRKKFILKGIVEQGVNYLDKYYIKYVMH